MRRIPTIAIAMALCLALAAPAFAQGATVHVVQPGENLFRIALRYGVTVEALAGANGLGSSRRIYSGQRLTIPARGAAAAPTSSSSGVHVAQKGENLYRIALRYGTTYQALAAANGIANPNQVYAGQRLVIPGQGTARQAQASPPAQSGRTYTVRRGDVLSSIALRNGVSTWALAQANDIRNPSAIYAGQVLRIPAGTSPALSSASPAPTGGGSGRWIDIDLSAQRLTAYSGNTPVRSTLVSTGLSRTPTPTG